MRTETIVEIAHECGFELAGVAPADTQAAPGASPLPMRSRQPMGPPADEAATINDTKREPGVSASGGIE